MKLVNPFDKEEIPAAPKFEYRPVGEMIQVEAVKAGMVMNGGIVMPGTANLNFLSCRAVAVGPKCVQVKAGDMVLVAKEGVIRAPHDGTQAMFITESRVISIVSLQGDVVEGNS